MNSIKDILAKDALTRALIENNGRKSHSETVQVPPVSSAQFRCSICEDRGIIVDGDVARPCICMQQKKLENQFRHARISRGLLKCRFENFRLDFYEVPNSSDTSHRDGALRAFQAAQEFVDQCTKSERGLGLLLSGPVGSGKTFLAASIANALTERNKQVLFLVVPDLLDELRATFKTDTNELDLLDTARGIPILILDDLGAHNYTEWTRNRIYSIVNYRMNEQLPTVVTTNLNLNEMEEYLGVRTTSRLIQMSRIFRLTVEEDIRLRLYQEREKR